MLWVAESSLIINEASNSHTTTRPQPQIVKYLLNHIKESCSDHTCCCYHPNRDAGVGDAGVGAYRCGWAVWKGVKAPTVTHCARWHHGIWCSSVTPNGHRGYCRPLTISFSMKQTIHPFPNQPFMQPKFAASDPTNEPALGGSIHRFVRDKGQVLVGPYMARASSVQPKSICLSPQTSTKKRKVLFFW